MSVLFVIAHFGPVLSGTGCSAVVLEGFAKSVGVQEGGQGFWNVCLLLKSCHHLNSCF